MSTLKLLFAVDSDSLPPLKKKLEPPESETSRYKYKIDWALGDKDARHAILNNDHNLYFVDTALSGQDPENDLIKDVMASGHKGPFILLTETEDDPTAHRPFPVEIYNAIPKDSLSPALLRSIIHATLERKNLERALKEEQNLTGFIISEIPYAVINVNKEGTVSSINNSFAQLTGYKRTMVSGKSWRDLVTKNKDQNLSFFISEDGHITFDSQLKDAQKNEKTLQWTVLSNNPNGPGKIGSAFVLFGRDITNQIEVQNRERERQKMEALGQLAGGVAHEINNLIQPILLSAELIKDHPTGPQGQDPTEFLKKNAERIIRNANATAQIVDDILTFSRKETQKKEILSFKETLDKTLTLVRDILPETILIKNDTSKVSDACTICINSHEMFRVLSNLLTNASHAMGQNGLIKINARIESLHRKCKKLNLARGDYIKIDISDTGAGIPTDILENIFNPFFTTKEIGEGTGLGLPIVYNLTQNWKGAVEVQSTVGEGSTFSLYIPVHGPP